MNPASNLFFIGPMGAGKTTIGRHTAQLLGLGFFDLDHLIEQRSGADIALIFDLEGEAGFRLREQALLVELAQHEGIVLATGGGVVLNEENRRLLKLRGFVVYLETDVDNQFARLKRDRKRPLLHAAVAKTGVDNPDISVVDDRRERLERLTQERLPLYQEIADLTVSANSASSAIATARRVAALLATHWQRLTKSH